MAIQITLAENGYLTPIAYGGGTLEAGPVNDGDVLATNGVYAIVDPADTDLDPADATFYLPIPPTGDDWTGNSIILKLLTTSDVTITLEGETNDDNVKVPIDGADQTAELSLINQTISFYYINATIGWLAGPAVL